jgi:tRNA A-37 threonylcarbamoyl transferase component Bud32
MNRPIATGRTAEIYAWNEGQILKLFYDWFGLENIEYEARIASAVYASGLPVPWVGDIVKVKGRNGLVYQRIDGTPMDKMLSRKPWTIIHAARRIAEIHLEMHATTLKVDLPMQRERLERKIQRACALPEELCSKALATLDILPDGNQLCHGDFHPANILVTPQAETIIDWIDATLGNPLADLARTTIILEGAAACQIHNPLEAGFIRWFHAIYLHHYFDRNPGGKKEYQRWLPVVAAARLSEGIPALETWLIRQAKT